MLKVKCLKSSPQRRLTSVFDLERVQVGTIVLV